MDTFDEQKWPIAKIALEFDEWWWGGGRKTELALFLRGQKNGELQNKP